MSSYQSRTHNATRRAGNSPQIVAQSFAYHRQQGLTND
jgi:hypothetical protein